MISACQGSYTVGTEDASPLTAVALISFTATGLDRGVLLEWRTGYEIDNLGFHVYREQEDGRQRLTTSLVAGSGLGAVRGIGVTAELSYAWWDMAVNQATPGIAYWLEDVDFAGVSTWHGPIVPVDGGHLLDVGPPAPGERVRGANSASLDGLGQNSGTSRRRFFTGRASVDEVDGDTLVSDPRQTQWRLAGRASVKIGVQRSGWYRLSQPQLLAAGLDPDVSPRTLALFVDGVEQAIRVTGEVDGRFDPSDVVEFYGVGVDTAYADTRVYWLAAGLGRGRRLSDRAPRPPRWTPRAPADRGDGTPRVTGDSAPAPLSTRPAGPSPARVTGRRARLSRGGAAPPVRRLREAPTVPPTRAPRGTPDAPPSPSAAALTPASSVPPTPRRRHRRPPGSRPSSQGRRRRAVGPEMDATLVPSRPRTTAKGPAGRAIDAERRERLTALGYDLSMSPAEYTRLQAIADNVSLGLLTEGDAAWLLDQLRVDPLYLDRLPRRGLLAPATDDDHSEDGFLPGLDAASLDALERVIATATEAAQADAAGGSQGADR